MIHSQEILAALALTNYLWFILGVWSVFRRDGEPGPGLRWIGLGALLACISVEWALFQSTDISGWRRWLSGAIWVGTLVGFGWCIRTTQTRRLSVAFSTDLPHFLHRHGPYAWVRHPFYTVYVTSYVAGIIATGAWHVTVLTAAMSVIYFRAARGEEAKFARSTLAAEYRTYRAETGMFFPRLLRSSGS